MERRAQSLLLRRRVYEVVRNLCRLGKEAAVSVEQICVVWWSNESWVMMGKPMGRMRCQGRACLLYVGTKAEMIIVIPNMQACQHVCGEVSDADCILQKVGTELRLSKII